MPILTDDQAVLRRVKALAATRPLHELSRNKAMWSDDIDWDRYDLATLALATVDSVAVNQTLSLGSTFDEVIAFCAGQAARQNPDAAEAETVRVAERVIEARARRPHATTQRSCRPSGTASLPDQPPPCAGRARYRVSRWSGGFSSACGARRRGVSLPPSVLGGRRSARLQLLRHGPTAAGAARRAAWQLSRRRVRQ